MTLSISSAAVSGSVNPAVVALINDEILWKTVKSPLPKV